MLPTKTFADAVAFLRLFDLSPLLVTNSLCSSLAVEASTSLRCEAFPGLAFYVLDRGIAVGTLEGGSAFATGSMDVIFVLFSTDAEIIDFLATALPNCIFEDLEIACDNEHLLDALGQVAESVIVRGAFSLPASVGPDDSIGIVRKLRKVKVSFFAVSMRHVASRMQAMLVFIQFFRFNF